MQPPRGRGDIALTHSYFGPRWGDWSASRPDRALPPRGKDPWYPLDRRLGRTHNFSGHRRRRKNPLPLPGNEPRASKLLSDIILTELPQLLDQGDKFMKYSWNCVRSTQSARSVRVHDYISWLLLTISRDGDLEFAEKNSCPPHLSHHTWLQFIDKKIPLCASAKIPVSRE
jgi:hypothetical protein